MAIDVTPLSRSTENGKLAGVIALGLSLGYAGALVSAYLSHLWIMDAQGHPVVEDFVAFWAAGHQALNGAAVAAYDSHAQHAAEFATVGHFSKATLGWAYPPVFLFVAALLACLPYTAAFLSWCAVTLVAYAGVAAAILRRPLGFVFACAAPWTLTGLMPGQNGFLTAALVGASLLSLQKRPALAGVLLGLLSYKPQFGILFPLVLGIAGYSRAFGWACVSTVAVNLLAAAVFGFGTLHGFVHALAGAGQNHLSVAGIGWFKLQSVYGLSRWMGASGQTAWMAQVLFSLSIAAVVSFCWRGSAPFELKAAVLAAAIPLATPYVFIYDLPVLTVACSFLYRDRRFDFPECLLLACAAAAVVGFLCLHAPMGLGASLIVAIIALRRAANAELGEMRTLVLGTLGRGLQVPVKEDRNKSRHEEHSPTIG